VSAPIADDALDDRTRFDAIVVGSGFGGAMVAHVLVNAGLDVLMLERGDWVPRGPHNWDDDGSLDLTPFATTEPPYRAVAGGTRELMHPYSCVGGPSVFYGGVSIRFREADFEPDPDIVGGSGACWPYDYPELEPFYTRAERILDVAGELRDDPTEPPHSEPYPQPPAPLSETSARVQGAARSLGLHPFRLPLAINYRTGTERAACIACTTCDTFACAIGAKNDLATGVLPALVERGLRLQPGTVVTRVNHEHGRVVDVECHHKETSRLHRYRAPVVVLAGGALGSPHLLLASGLEQANPAGHLVGRHLMRHCNAIVFGVFPRRPNRRRQFHKQLGIHDYYFGDPAITQPRGKLGSIQQLQTPPVGLVREQLPAVLGRPAGPVVEHLTGLLVMAEDQPDARNEVGVDWARGDRFGLPQATVSHRYSRRDLAARDALVRRSKKILRRAGAAACYVHRIKTFSHAVGTTRFGDDPASSVLDPHCGFRGIENLYVVDAGFMPTSAGLNPSLTISANALRVGDEIVRRG
jgi:choline dehydrogenase-like flavoprotein